MNPNNDSPFKELGLISHCTERAFYYMQCASVAQRLLRLSERNAEVAKFDKLRKLDAVKKRSRQVENYMLVWFGLELLLLVGAIFAGKIAGVQYTLATWEGWLTIFLFLVLPAYRVFEIFQTVININLFDPGRRPAKSQNYVASLARMVILSIWNYFEVVLCFAVAYSSPWASFYYSVPTQRPDNGLYFSFVTQLTIGYGDLSPLHATRIAATSQGCIGFILGIVVLSRLVAFLPKFDPVVHRQVEREPATPNYRRPRHLKRLRLRKKSHATTARSA